MIEEDVADLVRGFADEDERNYGHKAENEQVEIVNLRVTAIVPMPQPKLEAASLDGAQDPPDAVKARRAVYFKNESTDTPIYDRAKLSPGDMLSGPAIVEQLDSTTVVWPDQTAKVDAYGNLLLERVQK